MASKYLESFPLPPDLPNILDKLLKSLLHDQPTDIIRYCADYFSKMEHHQLRLETSKLTDSNLRKQV